MFKFYTVTKKPSDVFAYQDTTGEVTDVYRHCGFTLVKQAKKKHYLVAPGKTLKTGNRKEVLGLPYAIRFGPDRILGTSLGEVLREDGSRKSNVELFTEELGWHLEETSGDKVWEWINPNIKFYTYKITATNSEKYYFGVKSFQSDSLAEEACKTDGYYGSGTSEHFKRWKQVHQGELHKEILGLYHRKSAAYAAEKKLVGDLYRTDPNCLNSAPGGSHGGVNVEKTLVAMKFCSRHGESKHIGSQCYKCRDSGYAMEFCPIHKETSHKGGQCVRCEALRFFSKNECEKHGLSTFRKEKCERCKNEGLIEIRYCKTHGEVKHRGGACSSCAAEKAITTQHCPKHGMTKHQGDVCSKCHNERNLSVRHCSKHKMTVFIGDQCRKCSSANAITLRKCRFHGLVKHQGAKCATCHSEKARSMEDCAKHKLTLHRGGKCQKCEAEKQKKIDTCVKHGEQTFYRGTCPKCKGEKVRHTRSHVKNNVIDPTCTYC